MENRGYDSSPEGTERCTCHRISDGGTNAYDGPVSAAQCAHLLCHYTGYHAASRGRQNQELLVPAPHGQNTILSQISV